MPQPESLKTIEQWRERIMAFQLGCLLKEMYVARQTHETHFIRYPHHTQAEYEKRLGEVRAVLEEGFGKRGFDNEQSKKLAGMVMGLLDYNVENRLYIKEALALVNSLN